MNQERIESTMRPDVFIRQRIANFQRHKSEGKSAFYWLASGIGRYLTTYSQRLVEQPLAAASVTELESDRTPGLTGRLATSRSLNFGCGYDKRDGFVNVDSDPACRPDVLIGVDSMTAFPTSFYETVVAKDVLEHIPRLFSLRMLLLFNDWLVDGGRLELQTSSILDAADLLRSKNDFSHHFGMVNCLFGSQMHPGDFHYTGFTETTLKVMLSAAHFSFGDFSLVDGWMFKLEARKASPWYEWSTAVELSQQEFMKAVFDRALGREAHGHETLAFADLVGRLGRRAAALEIFSSPERLMLTAKALGY